MGRTLNNAWPMSAGQADNTERGVTDDRGLVTSVAVGVGAREDTGMALGVGLGGTAVAVGRMAWVGEGEGTLLAIGVICGLTQAPKARPASIASARYRKDRRMEAL